MLKIKMGTVKEKTFYCTVILFNGKYHWQRPIFDVMADSPASAASKAVDRMVGEYQKIHNDTIESISVNIKCKSGMADK